MPTSDACFLGDVAAAFVELLLGTAHAGFGLGDGEVLVDLPCDGLGILPSARAGGDFESLG